MFFQALKLLWITAIVYNQTHAQSLCALHILEDIEQEGMSINIEKISFNEIITSLLELIITAEKSDFSRVTGNFILGNANTCSQLAKGLTLEDARKLQREGITERIYLSLHKLKIKLIFSWVTDDDGDISKEFYYTFYSCHFNYHYLFLLPF